MNLKKEFARLALTLTLVFTGTAAFSAVITSYDIQNANISGTGSWSHNYSGTITPTSGGLADYSGGSGTLNSGTVSANHIDNQLFIGSSAPTITLHLDGFYFIDTIELFGANGATGNGIPGSLTSVNVGINGSSQDVATTAFGTQNTSSGWLVNDRLDLSSLTLSSLYTDTITLSNFQGLYSGIYFNLAEIEINGTQVGAVPVPAALFMFAPALLGFMGLRRKAKATIA